MGLENKTICHKDEVMIYTGLQVNKKNMHIPLSYAIGTAGESRKKNSCSDGHVLKNVGYTLGHIRVIPQGDVGIKRQNREPQLVSVGHTVKKSVHFECDRQQV